MNGLTSSLNGKLALRQPPREQTSRKARLALATEMPAEESALRLLLNDPLATINVLKKANDAYYGLRGSVGSLTHAVEILGGEACLRELASTRHQSTDRPAQLVLTRHASVAAQIAHRMANGHWLGAEGSGFNPGMVATTALFHNIGRLAFSVSLPLESETLYGFSQSPFPITGSLAELEQLQFGINHVELGGFILHHLHFPSEMQEAVKRHRCVGDSPVLSSPSRLGWIVGASCLLAEAAGYGLDPQVSLQHNELDVWLQECEKAAAIPSDDMTAIRSELTEPGALLLDDDPTFTVSEESLSDISHDHVVTESEDRNPSPRRLDSARTSPATSFSAAARTATD